MVENGLSETALLVTSEAYSKYIHPGDASVRTLFGDGASATLVQGRESDEDLMGPFVFGTDGSGAENLIVRPSSEPGLQRGRLFMNGPELFTFASRTVPRAVEDLLRQASLEPDDVDYFIFHQANLYMIEHLRKKIGIPKERFAYCLEDCGNTVSTSIPLALGRAVESGAIRSGMRVALVGFGVGYSWAAGLIRWA
jgi:3-oxoacyl-[acyl-carrier-protein] synthase-3